MFFDRSDGNPNVDLEGRDHRRRADDSGMARLAVRVCFSKADGRVCV